MTITGLARPPLAAKPSMLVPDNDTAKNVFYWKDLAAMTTSAGLDPARVLSLFVDADATANPGGLPIGGVTQVDLPNNHLQYAVTWYGLALALAGVVVTAGCGGGPRRRREGRMVESRTAWAPDLPLSCRTSSPQGGRSAEGGLTGPFDVPVEDTCL